MKKVLWFTGRSGAGKTTIANYIFNELKKQNIDVILFDSDSFPLIVGKDKYFTEKDRKINQLRIIALIKKYLEKNYIVIVSFISPFRKERENFRKIFKDSFVEIFVNTPLEVCIKRDPKNQYKKGIKEFLEIQRNYEEPINPELIINTEKLTVENAGKKILSFIFGEK